MAESLPLEDPIARGFVESVLRDWSGELAFATGVLPALGKSRFDVTDLLAVIQDGVTTAMEKEDPHATLFERTGRTDDSTPLCVTLSYCPQLRGLTVVCFAIP